MTNQATHIQLSDRAQDLLQGHDVTFEIRYRQTEFNPKVKPRGRNGGKTDRSNRPHAAVQRWLPSLTDEFFLTVLDLFENDRWYPFSELLDQIRQAEPCNENYLLQFLRVLKAVSILQQSGNDWKLTTGCDRVVSIGTVVVTNPLKRSKFRQIGVVVGKQALAKGEGLLVRWVTENPAGAVTLISSQLSYPVDRWYEPKIAIVFKGGRQCKVSYTSQIEAVRKTINGSVPKAPRAKSPEERLLDALKYQSQITLGKAQEIAGITCDRILNDFQRAGKIEVVQTFPRSIRATSKLFSQST